MAAPGIQKYVYIDSIAFVGSPQQINRFSNLGLKACGSRVGFVSLGFGVQGLRFKGPGDDFSLISLGLPLLSL